jgi:hypothetical protein
MLCVCCVLTRCIHIFIYAVRCMGKILGACFPWVYFICMGAFLKFVFSKLSHFCSDATQLGCWVRYIMVSEIFGSTPGLYGLEISMELVNLPYQHLSYVEFG